MLSVQSRISAQNVNFGKKLSPEEIQARREEAEYIKKRNEMLEHKRELEELANDDELNLPKPLNKALKGGAIVTTGILGGMAAGWGAGKSWSGISKLIKSKPVQGFIKKTVSAKDSVVKFAESLKEKFLNSKLYTKPAKAVKAQKTKFLKTKFGKKLTSIYNSIKENKIVKSIVKGYTTVKTKVKDAFKHIHDKIKGVKPEAYKKATENTVGVSGGIASGVTALKDKSETGAEE